MKSVCLYCGSQPGHEPGHSQVARALGTGIAAAGWRLVYGAGDHGLMGEASRAARARGGAVTGFIPRHLVELEVANRDLTELVITDTMHERKKLMLGNADGVVALPGGPGTLDELVEVLTWRYLGLHRKPVVLINASGYWDPLLALFEHMETGGFVSSNFLGGLTLASTAEEALRALSSGMKAA